MFKTFIEGFLYMFGLGSNPIQTHRYASDKDALAADWNAVGGDIRKAINTYADQQQQGN